MPQPSPAVSEGASLLRFRAEVDVVDSTPKSTTLPAALPAPPSVPRRGVRVPPVLRSRLPKVVDGRPRAARAEDEERALADRIPLAPPPPPTEESPKEAVEDDRDMPAVDIIAARLTMVGVRICAESEHSQLQDACRFSWLAGQQLFLSTSGFAQKESQRAVRTVRTAALNTISNLTSPTTFIRSIRANPYHKSTECTRMKRIRLIEVASNWIEHRRQRRHIVPEEHGIGNAHEHNRTKRPSAETELQNEEAGGVTVDIEVCSGNEERIVSSRGKLDQDRPSSQDDVTVEHTTPRPEPEPSSEKWRRRRILSVYLLTSTILYADLALMAPNLSAIAEEFGFDDDERDVRLGGVIALCFFLVGTPVALLIGWLADFCNRSPLYAITVFLGDAACLGTYFVSTYQQLVVTRTLTGISIGGALPVIFSVLGDLYPTTQRNAVAAIVTIGTGLGSGVGQALAGFLGPKYGWRFPFLVVSVPGMVCSFLLLMIRDPQRGQKEQARIEFDEERRAHVDDYDEESNSDESPNVPIVAQRQNEKVSWKTTWEMIKTPSITLIFLQAAPASLPFGFGSVFLNDYLAQDRGIGVEEATGVLITFGAGNAIGVCLGGAFGHVTYKIDQRIPPLIMGSSLILSCIPMYFLINWVDATKNLSIVAVLGMITGALATIPVPLERAILTNVTVPESRGRANSFLSIIDDLGKGLGPALVSVLIQAFDRSTAFNMSLLGWIVGGLISFLIFFFVRQDEDRTQERVREAIIRDEGLRFESEEMDL